MHNGRDRGHETELCVCRARQPVKSVLYQARLSGGENQQLAMPVLRWQQQMESDNRRWRLYTEASQGEGGPPRLPT